MNDLPFPLSESIHVALQPLVRRADFQLGHATVRPSLRTIEGPQGAAKGEPRVIQVLVALADAQGRVLSRDDLLRLCWDGRIVGDDAINRAIAEVRRIVASTGAGFEVETVPRVGYRLTGIDWNALQVGEVSTDPSPTMSRRTAILVGGASVIAAGTGAAMLLHRRDEEHVTRLIERGRLMRAMGLPGSQAGAKQLFLRAASQDPGRAEAWGWLSVVELVDGSTANARAQDAAQRALALDPKEANARSTIALLRRDLDDWVSYENDLLGIVKDDPGCAPAHEYLTLFLQSVGRCRDSLASNERAVSLEPFSPKHQSRRAMKHWIFGRIGEADKVADRLLQLRPRDPNAWNARLIIYAFTGRAEAALALLDDVPSRPANLKAPSINSWRAGLIALASRASRDIAIAVATYARVAPLSPGLAANAIMVFSALGELDAAYTVADGLLNNRGPLVLRSREPRIQGEVYSNPVWGRTQFLFIPATSSFRDDERFPDLCERMGHVAYWQERGIWPDAFVSGSLTRLRTAAANATALRGANSTNGH
ncbi:winged helix-turn-helix domain-containing protein [Novosphingobium sp. Gsoil 351]|uniref:winged helix-turn-helix domain-containing protein n=1 Tax=Novosphingobium sp. Gsoil 351 TaxID=2675225 RepID=UPI0018A8667A|nr:winged helix-turn-helix domain-containing protein [Novosphingobium sp. Gsoil 351]